MKVILIANVAANGQVALSGKSNHVAPQEAFSAYFQKAIGAGNIVLGTNTYQVLSQFPGAKEVLASLKVVVLSRTDKPHAEYTVANTPKQAVDYLHEQGFSEICVGGGVQVYNAFLTENLVTDLYLDVLPIVIGDGGLLRINDGDVLTFKLVEQSAITPDVVQLHFSNIQQKEL